MLNFLGLCLILGLVSCGQNTTSSNAYSPPKTGAWTTSLEKVLTVAKKSSNIRSLLVSIDGQIVLEEYFAKYGLDSLDHQRSGTKSIMATLIGIAIDKQFIKEIDEPVANYLPGADPRLQEITIKHLLTMTSGFEWDEALSVKEYNTWVSSGDQLGYLLRKPIAERPGSTWNYNSATMHLLSIILTKASGKSTHDFAEEHLFKPLGIQNSRWEQLAGGYHNGGAGLELHPRDMVRLGQVIANQGNYKGEQVISKQFIRAATSHQEPEPFASDENVGYGYGWWVGEPNGVKVILARGYAGQLIAIFPETQIVVVMTHNWRLDIEAAIEQQEQGFKILAAILMENISGIAD